MGTEGNEGRAPTLDDVAKAAAVSSATVSRFLNNPQVVAAGTAERIRSAIDKTGYIPNALAGELASKKSRMLAVFIPHLENSLFSDTIEKMVEEMTASGNNVMLGLTGASPERATSLIRAALSRRVDAIVSTGPLTEELVAIVKRSTTLFIQIWDLPEDPVGIAVGFSHRAAGRDIARFVELRGYRRPHLVTAEGLNAQRRRDAFVEEWARLSDGAAPTESSVPAPSRFGHARGVFSEIMRLEERPDIVVCGSDYLAQGMIVEAQNAGLNVPRDLGVIGFGNSSLAGEMRPTITSVDVDGARIAREVMAAVKQQQDGLPFASRHVDVGFRLISRDSV